MPSPYPRACSHCAKSKKRCNLGIPNCSRCQLRSLDCRYESIPDRVEQNLSDVQLPTGVPPHTRGIGSLELQSWVQTPDFVDADHVVGDAPFLPDFDRDWPTLMTSIDDFVVPDQVGPGHSVAHGVLAGHIYQERIVYVVKRMQSYPSLFVCQGRTPFLHGALYNENMPAAIQDVLASSALYGAKTPANRTLVFTTIRERVRHLIELYDDFQGSAFEQLAAIQALVLYQIIRYFDGDIRLRADAERDEPTLTRWVEQVRLRAKHAATEASEEFKSDLISTSDPWRSWMFAESQRRTLIVCILLKGLYFFLKNGYASSIDDFKQLSFFAQTALWLAPSEYHWRRAVEKYRILPVSCSNWDADMADAEPTDVEELGMTVMVLMKGVDHCSEWVGERQLERFGLLHE